MRLCEAKVKSGESRRNQQRTTTNMAIGSAGSGERQRLTSCNRRLDVGMISAASSSEYASLFEPAPLHLAE